MNYLKKDRWSPYVVGVLIGILSWITFGYMDKILGVSSTLVHIVALIENTFWPEHVKNLTYLHNKLSINWQFLFVIGIFIGSFLAALTSGTFSTNLLPKIWSDRFRTSKLKFYVGSFLGGILLLIGARLAGGCTSGLALSGGLELSLSGWVFFPSFFISGIIFSHLFYKKS